MTSHHINGRSVLAAFALVLAGCSLLSRPPPKTAEHPAAQTPQTVKTEHRPAHRPHPVAATPATGSAAAAGRLATTRAEQLSAPVRVVGLSRDAVRQLLGPPAAQHTHGPAQTWTYEGAGCQVDIAFYFDVTRNGFFALSDRPVGGGEAGACLARIHDAHLP